MKITIGLVCEGARDQEILCDLIDSFFPEEEISYKFLQPEPSLLSPYYNGWKGVLRWCGNSYEEIKKINEAITPKLNLLIIQLDGDVSRDEKNKQSHCGCISLNCKTRAEITKEAIVYLENCPERIADCPITYPCANHMGIKPDQYITHLKSLIMSHLGSALSIPVVITIPCDSIDAWIAAAYEETDQSFELIEKPWESIIARRKTYHGIRISGSQKSGRVYNELRKGIIENWQKVKSRCSQAKVFESDVLSEIQYIREQYE